MIHIAIIDDGVNENSYNIGKLEYNVEIDHQMKIKKRVKYDSYSSSHGSICAAIIKKYFDYCTISSIKILNTNSKMASTDQLVKAIDYCIVNNLKLINLSIGTIDQNDYSKLKGIINYAYKNKVIVVAANNNNNNITYPASLSNVIGVRCDTTDKLKENEYNYYIYPYDGIDILAFSKHSLKRYSGEVLRLKPSNSFATPYITSKVAEIIEKYKDMSLEKIRNILLKNSSNYQLKSFGYVNYNPYICSNIDWIDNALLFSLSKTGISSSSIIYDFKIIKNIRIKCESLYLGLISIINYVNKNDNIINIADTIVIFIDNNITINFENKKNLKFIYSLKKSIVYVTQNKKVYEYFTLFNSNYVKLWNPYIDIVLLENKKNWWYYFLKFIKQKIINYCKHIYNNIFIKINKQALVNSNVSICILDFTQQKYVNMCYELKQLFVKDGYRTISIVDTILGKLYGLDFIFAHNNLTNNIYMFLNKLDKLIKIYREYVFIYGMSALNQKINSCINIMNLIEIDLYVLIIDNYSEDICKIINSRKNDVIILITATSDVKHIKLKHKNIKILYFYDKNITSKIYSYILSLYS